MGVGTASTARHLAGGDEVTPPAMAVRGADCAQRQGVASSCYPAHASPVSATAHPETAGCPIAAAQVRHATRRRCQTRRRAFAPCCVAHAAGRCGQRRGCRDQRQLAPRDRALLRVRQPCSVCRAARCGCGAAARHRGSAGCRGGLCRH